MCPVYNYPLFECTVASCNACLYCCCFRGVIYDIYLKFEERAHWQPLLFAYLGLDKDLRFKINYMPADAIDGQPSATATAAADDGKGKGLLSGKGDRKGRRRRSGGLFDFRPQQGAETRASDKAVILQHYSRDLLDIVARLYKTDIDLFHYHNEVRDIYSYFDSTAGP